MRIARYLHANQPVVGFVRGHELIDIRSVPGITARTARELITEELPGEDALADLPGVPLAEVTLLPPIELEKVACAGVNFPTHRAEASFEEQKPPHPVIFTRFSDSHVGHGEDLYAPEGNATFDYEGELAVVIGKLAWQVDPADAMQHVFGYSCYNDGSVRDWQMHTSQWIPGKNFYRSGSIGPWIVSADEIDDIDTARLTTRVDGIERQSAQIKDMVHSISELIAYVSTFTPLRPGDVIAAGTPGGVGMFMTPPTYLEPGQTVEVEIEGIGTLRNRFSSSPELVGSR